MKNISQPQISNKINNNWLLLNSDLSPFYTSLTFSYFTLVKSVNDASGVGEILGLMMGRLLDANGLEEELKYYKSVTTEAKRILPNPVVKAA